MDKFSLKSDPEINQIINGRTLEIQIIETYNNENISINKGQSTVPKVIGSKRQKLNVSTHSLANLDKPNALILDTDTKIPVIVDPFIAKNLTDYQREGVKFLYDALIKSNCKGAILADEM